MHINIVLGPFKPPPPAPSGAIEKVWWRLAATFAGRGHPTTVIGPDHPDLPRGDSIDGIRFLRLPLLDRGSNVKMDIIRDFGWSRSARRHLPRADVTVTNCFWLPWILRSKKRRASAGVGVLNMHVQRFPKGQMFLYGGVDRISTVSQAIVDGISGERPAFADRISLIGNPVDLEVFHPIETRAETPSDRPIRILYTGRIHPEKGLHLLVEAWQRLLSRGRNFELRLVGPSAKGDGGGGPDYVRRLKDLAGDAPLELPGGVADPTALADELRSADLYCYPSIAAKGEASPVAPLEAMACGLPPVVADLPQYSAYIQNDRTGLVFTRGDGEIDSLTEALERLSDDPELRQRLSAEAITAASRYGIEKIADSYLADFQESIDELREGRHRP
ncbi:MAG: glycosyltransferase family 4 protein [Phycisphaerales bacterium]|jgi:glycosyltransferase involved in cell wall biosynthesis|nr:glycosyltransferase family 4 protein [Phycisphaerales bacterium]